MKFSRSHNYFGPLVHNLTSHISTSPLVSISFIIISSNQSVVSRCSRPISCLIAGSQLSFARVPHGSTRPLSSRLLRYVRRKESISQFQSPYLPRFSANQRSARSLYVNDLSPIVSPCLQRPTVRIFIVRDTNI